MAKEDRKFRRIYQKARIGYYTNAVARRLTGRNLTEPKYKRPVLTDQEGNDRLYEMVLAGRPFAATRFGGTETKTIADVLYTKAGGRCGGVSDRTLTRIMQLSGFFPADREALNRFVDLYMECCTDIDLLGVWNILLQSYLADECVKNADLAELRMFEPYYFARPWTRALEGKKVAVIHPFAETIEKQYKKRQQLFENKSILPEFELRCVKAVQTLAGNKCEHATWFDALEWMYSEIMQEEFDVALLGCGAYGLPLAVKIKRAGKQAVHVGGSLQLFFWNQGKPLG